MLAEIWTWPDCCFVLPLLGRKPGKKILQNINKFCPSVGLVQNLSGKLLETKNLALSQFKDSTGLDIREEPMGKQQIQSTLIDNKGDGFGPTKPIAGF